MDTLLAGIGWMFGFIGLGILFNMEEVLNTIRAFAPRHPVPPASGGREP